MLICVVFSNYFNKDVIINKKRRNKMEDDKSVKLRKTVTIISLILMFALWGAAFYYVGNPLIKYISEPEKFQAWVDSHGIMGRVLFIAAMTLQIVVAIIPGEPFEIAAGYAFGFWEGTLLCEIAILLGSAVVFIFVKNFGVKALQLFFPLEKINSLKFIRNSDKFRKIVFAVMLIPGTPKDLLTYAAGLTPLQLKEWLVLTCLARIPSVVTSTIGGHALGGAEYLTAIIVFAVTAAVSLLGLYVFNKISARKNGDGKMK